MEPESDYITVSPTTSPHKCCVMVMRYQAAGDQYIATRVSAKLPEVAARALAQSWAQALRLEIR